MSRLSLHDLPLGTLLCGGLLVAACVLFACWSSAHAAELRLRSAEATTEAAAPPRSADTTAAPTQQGASVMRHFTTVRGSTT